MPYTIVVAVPKPISKIDKIELDKVQAYFIEESEEYNGWYAGYKPAVIRKLGVDNIDVFYVGCFEQSDYWSSYHLFDDNEFESHLHVSEERFDDFFSVFETLFSISGLGKLYMILHNGVSIRDEAELTFAPELPSEKYVNYSLVQTDYQAFLYKVKSNSTEFEVESIWEITKI